MNNIIYFVIAEIVIILVLLIYNIFVSKRVKVLKSGKENLKKLYTLKEILEVTKKSDNVNSKLNEINNILIKNLELTNSHIVVFTGINYDIKASNIQEENKKDLFNVIKTEVFQNSILENKEQYITVENENTSLPYTENRDIKACIFYPLYKNEGFLGYWLIESNNIKGLDFLDKEILTNIKESILNVVHTLFYQKATETFVEKDNISNLNSKEYLLTKGRERLEKTNAESTVLMFNVLNINEINNNYSREIGNSLINKIGELLNTNYSNYIFARYLGPKFVVILDNMSLENTDTKLLITNLKTNLESIGINIQNTNDNQNEKNDSISDEIDSIDIIEENISKNYINAEIKIEAITYKPGYELDTILKTLESKMENKIEN